MTGLRGTFRAMDTVVEIVGTGIADRELASMLNRAREFADAWEEMFSRFRAGSTLQTVNAAGGAPTQVEPAFLDLLERARQAVFASAGRFNPAVLPALEAAGYDRSFASITATIAGRPEPCAWHEEWGEVEIDRSRHTVRLPAGMRLDVGGIAKGAYVDQLADWLTHWPGGMVNAGGDMMIWGEPPTGHQWRIGVEDPARPGTDIAAIEFGVAARRGVATSATNRRRWMVSGHTAHHLIDPFTGAPASGPVASVTAVGPDVTSADVGAKVLFMGCSSGDMCLPPAVELAIVVDQSGACSVLELPKGDVHAS